MWKIKNNFYRFMKHITFGGIRNTFKKLIAKHQQKKLDVCYICDEGYVKPTFASIISMILNKKKQTFLHIRIIGVDISAYAVASFNKFNRYSNVKLDVINVKNPYDNIQTTHRHVSKAAMLKFKIPNIFPNLDKILYIDGDTIIRHDLTELNKIDLTNNYAAVAPDMLANVFGHQTRLGLDKYFNSGVMLLNLDLCRQDGIEARLVYNKKNDEAKIFMDQDAFNQTFNGRVVWLSPKYNTIMLNDNRTRYSFSEKAQFFGLTETELYFAYADSHIVHLTNKLKPWKNIEATDFYLWDYYYKKWQRLQQDKGLFYTKLYEDNTQETRLFGIKLRRKPIKSELVDFGTSDNEKFDGIHICFTEGGGMGDCLLVLPFIEHVYNSAPTKIKIDFYCKSPEYFQHLYYLNYVDKMPNKVTDLSGKYDGVFQTIRYGRFISGNVDKIKTKYPVLYKYIQMDEQIRKIGQIRDSLRLFNEYALTLGKKRPQHVDLFDIFGYNADKAKINFEMDESHILEKFQLKPKSYITVSRGADGVFNSNHPKLWPLENYEKLIKLIKQNYPNLQIVQIGATDKFGVIPGVDINLLKQTSFTDVAAILKNATFHIGEEGGLVHLNHFVGGKSIVLFGPTSADVYGYPENINISGTCPLGNCYNLTSHWSEKCVLGHGKCMRSITPQTVFEKVQEMLYPTSWFKIVDATTHEELQIEK